MLPVKQSGSIPSPSNLGLVNAENPPPSCQAVADSTAQPLQLIEQREKHNAIPELQIEFQRSRDLIGADKDTDWWLKLATWWLVKVSLNYNDHGAPWFGNHSDDV